MRCMLCQLLKWTEVVYNIVIYTVYQVIYTSCFVRELESNIREWNFSPNPSESFNLLYLQEWVKFKRLHFSRLWNSREHSGKWMCAEKSWYTVQWLTTVVLEMSFPTIKICHSIRLLFNFIKGIKMKWRKQQQQLQLMLHLRTTFDNYADIFLMFELNIWHFIFQKYCFYAIYKLYYFTSLIFWNNIYENVSIRRQGSILKPKSPFPVHALLFACTIRWKFQDSFSIT